MKLRTFTLTPNEQRVVVLVVLVLLAAAFVRYWTAVHAEPGNIPSTPASATASPSPSAEEESEHEQE